MNLAVGFGSEVEDLGIIFVFTRKSHANSALRGYMSRGGFRDNLCSLAETLVQNPPCTYEWGTEKDGLKFGYRW
jgi:hypothetical protein